MSAGLPARPLQVSGSRGAVPVTHRSSRKDALPPTGTTDSGFPKPDGANNVRPAQALRMAFSRRMRPDCLRRYSTIGLSLQIEMIQKKAYECSTGSPKRNATMNSLKENEAADRLMLNLIGLSTSVLNRQENFAQSSTQNDLGKMRRRKSLCYFAYRVSIAHPFPGELYDSLRFSFAQQARTVQPVPRVSCL